MLLIIISINLILIVAVKKRFKKKKKNGYPSITKFQHAINRRYQLLPRREKINEITDEEKKIEEKLLGGKYDIEEFVLKPYYDKEQFEHLIDRYVNEMLLAIKNSKKLYDAGWDIHNVIVDRFNVACDYFGDVVYLKVKTF